MFYNPPIVKWLGISLTYKGKVGWEHRGVIGRRGDVYSATTVYTLSHIAKLDSLMCTACKKDIIYLMLKSSASTACINFNRSLQRLLSFIMKSRYQEAGRNLRVCNKVKTILFSFTCIKQYFYKQLRNITFAI